MGKEAKKLIQGSGIVFIGTIVGSFFSYLFNMLTGRWLGPELYGEFTALMSLMMVLSVASGAVLTVTMKYSSDLFANKELSALNKLVKRFSKYVLVFALILFFASLLFIKPIASFFSIGSFLSIIITLSGFIFGFLIVVNRGVLQGTQSFLPLSITNALEMLLRLLIGVFLIKLGMSLPGAMSSVVLATAIIYFITLTPIKKILSQKTEKDSENFKFNKTEIINYTLPAFIATLLLVIALNIDVILVKHYFSSETAGVYAAISTIGKIILYATGPIVGVMFPMISEKKTIGEKHYKLFLFSILLTIAGGLIILGLYIIAPGTIIRVLYGSAYVTYYSLLSKVGFFILLYALVNIMANYYLAIKDFIFLYFFGAILILQFALISLEHSSLENVVKILIGTTALLFALLFGYYLITKREQIQQLLSGNAEG